MLAELQGPSAARSSQLRSDAPYIGETRVLRREFEQLLGISAVQVWSYLVQLRRFYGKVTATIDGICAAKGYSRLSRSAVKRALTRLRQAGLVKDNGFHQVRGRDGLWHDVYVRTVYGGFEEGQTYVLLPHEASVKFSTLRPKGKTRGGARKGTGPKPMDEATAKAWGKVRKTLDTALATFVKTGEPYPRFDPNYGFSYEDIFGHVGPRPGTGKEVILHQDVRRALIDWASRPAVLAAFAPDHFSWRPNPRTPEGHAWRVKVQSEPTPAVGGENSNRAGGAKKALERATPNLGVKVQSEPAPPRGVSVQSEPPLGVGVKIQTGRFPLARGENSKRAGSPRKVKIQSEPKGGSEHVVSGVKIQTKTSAENKDLQSIRRLKSESSTRPPRGNSGQTGPGVGPGSLSVKIQTGPGPENNELHATLGSPGSGCAGVKIQTGPGPENNELAKAALNTGVKIQTGPGVKIQTGPLISTTSTMGEDLNSLASLGSATAQKRAVAPVPSAMKTETVEHPTLKRVPAPTSVLSLVPDLSLEKPTPRTESPPVNRKDLAPTPPTGKVSTSPITPARGLEGLAAVFAQLQANRRPAGPPMIPGQSGIPSAPYGLGTYTRPPPPKLPRDLTFGEQLHFVEAWYRLAVYSRTGRQSRVSLHSPGVRRIFEDALTMFLEKNLRPGAWVAWACDQYLQKLPDNMRARTEPPLKYVLGSALMLGEMRHFFRESGGSDATVVSIPEGQELMSRWHAFENDLRVVWPIPPEEIQKKLKAHFPEGYEKACRKVAEKAREAGQEVLKQIKDAKTWIWPGGVRVKKGR